MLKRMIRGRMWHQLDAIHYSMGKKKNTQTKPVRMRLWTIIGYYYTDAITLTYSTLKNGESLGGY